MPRMPITARRVFWSRTKTLTLVLLGAWLAINLAVPWWARELSALQVAGFPLGYWLAAEGTLLMYLVLIVIYVLAMDRLERSYLQQEADAAAESRSVPASGSSAP
jgi:putative solute:sodium symporter small subunit